ncbi:XdhC family protein [Paenibacillus sp. N4]|uniref:XdhC family protein n=1 Tax=Paenibacillus vietnamensis TaxID=2590547 RepID=UPI001CD0E60C|nr:XdhC family protein [Paenibacillus vietnamensis]MCA0754165.1 XdhC family protein [Paenibacillus vietnamensis]
MELDTILSAINEDDGPGVLATIVKVEGHAYRKAGASMLFKLSGEQVGTISPGCLEQDLAERAPAVWESGRHAWAEYDMDPDEDVIWGDAIGCGGKIKLLLEPVAGTLRSILLDVHRHHAQRRTVMLVRRWHGDLIEYDLSSDPSDALPFCFEAGVGSLAVRLTQQISPRPRLVLFGAGRDADAIYGILKQIGFQLVIADWRSGLCTRERFPEAECIVGTPEELAGRLKLQPDDYLIINSHHLQQDREMLRLTLPLQLVYIGVMGSKKRIKLLFETFLIPSNVRAPIGLSIGADGPYEIAASIAAELIAIRAGRKARSGKEAARDAYFSPLFGGGGRQAHGIPEAAARAGERAAARRNGAACSINKPS